ncbi:MAG: TIGR03435 family protein [Acidobacteriota bacterium]
MALHVWILAAALYAQQVAAPAAPKFDVVSIRELPPNGPLVLREEDFTPILPRGQYIDSSTNLLFMISFAYNVVAHSDKQLTGLPNWAKTQSYAVAAKPADTFPLLSPAENKEQVRQMLRAMLEDRFQLRLHKETRQENILNLVVDKGGIKLRQVDAPVPPEKEGRVNAAVSDSRGRLIATKGTVSGIANIVALFMNQTVVDQTGLNGYYDFDIRWSAPEARTQGFGPEGESLLISNLQDQFGLRLTKGSGPVEYWVIDQIKPPAEN